MTIKFSFCLSLIIRIFLNLHHSWPKFCAFLCSKAYNLSIHLRSQQRWSFCVYVPSILIYTKYTQMLDVLLETEILFKRYWYFFLLHYNSVQLIKCTVNSIRQNSTLTSLLISIVPAFFTIVRIFQLDFVHENKMMTIRELYLDPWYASGVVLRCTRARFPILKF